MLGLDLDMEAELGIDSIKRVEILGELQNLGLVPDALEMDRLSRCRTLGQVVETVEEARPGDAEPCRAAPEWLGVIESYTPGRELVALRRLDARTDRVATHHTLGGRRISAVEPDRLGFPVIPFTVMAELLAQAASALVPGKVVVGVRDLQANRWIRYEDAPFDIELRASRASDRPDEVVASIRTLGADRARKGSADVAAVEGVLLFADQRTPGPAAGAFVLPEAQPCGITTESIYRDQWLFHGPALQAVCRVGGSSRHGIEGTLRVLPRRELFPAASFPTLHTDPIVLDAFTHLLGCWGLDKQAGEEGDVIFPLRLASMTLYGDDPAEGSSVECRVRVLEVSHYRVKVEAELVGPDGRVWVELRGWEDWRFYWPVRYRDFFRMPDTVMVGEPLDLRTGVPIRGRAVGVWLEPPADMGKPVWRDVLEWVQLATEERQTNRAQAHSEQELTRRIWERVALKEAARRLLLERGEPPMYPADLVASPDLVGGWVLESRLDTSRFDLPCVSVGSTDGVALAVAVDGRDERPGVAIERLENRKPGEAGTPLDAEVRHWLERDTLPGRERESWLVRLRCAFRAGYDALGKRSGLSFVEADKETGEVVLRVADGRTFLCATSVRGDHVWAWTCVVEDDR
jgi:hypothetical protein